MVHDIGTSWISCSHFMKATHHLEVGRRETILTLFLVFKIIITDGDYFLVINTLVELDVPWNKSTDPWQIINSRAVKFCRPSNIFISHPYLSRLVSSVVVTPVFLPHPHLLWMTVVPRISDEEWHLEHITWSPPSSPSALHVWKIELAISQQILYWIECFCFQKQYFFLHHLSPVLYRLPNIIYSPHALLDCTGRGMNPSLLVWSCRLLVVPFSYLVHHCTAVV